MSDPTLTVREERRDDTGPKRLLVFFGDAVSTRALPPTGTLTIGRAEEADLRLDAPSISRLHARIHAGSPVQVEDLGSANGTWVGGKQLGRGAPVELVVGDSIRIGDATLVLQRPPVLSAFRPRRLLTHDWFEARLEEACALAPPAGLSVVRLRLEGAASPGIVEQAIVDTAGDGDLVASYGPGEYEVLLLDADRARAERFVSDVQRLLGPRSSVRAGLGVFGRDGRTADELLEQACKELTPAAAHSPQVVVRSPEMDRLYEVAHRIAQSPLSVVLLGETGAGKEVLAEEIHRASPRRAKPFVKLNCAALPETLLEAELFGYERGAFTGANKSRAGLIESAEGGTVMLDEAGELPMALQPKLLRVLEQREVRRLGDNRVRSVDVRFIAATNRDLEVEIREKRFREDLYFRLCGIALAIPPLRERPSELLPLARQFVAQACKESSRPELTLSPEATALLQAYSWPGNIRELKNAMERAVVLCAGTSILPEHLPQEKMLAPLLPARRAVAGPPEPASLDGGPEYQEERAKLLAALDGCAGNQTLAAKVLGISRRTLLTRLDEYNIPRPRKSHRT